MEIQGLQTLLENGSDIVTLGIFYLIYTQRQIERKLTEFQRITDSRIAVLEMKARVS